MGNGNLPSQHPAGARLSKANERQRSFVIGSGKHRGASAGDLFFLNKKLCVEAVVFFFFGKKWDGLSLDDDGWMMRVFFFLVGLGKSVFHFVSF